MRVLMTGGTGFIGGGLQATLATGGHTVELVSRRPDVGRSWEPESLRAGVAAADVVIHLAGAGVMDRRWSPAYKREILTSRVDTTRQVATCCAEVGRRLVSTSAVGFYGPGRMDQTCDEDAPCGSDFLATVCQAWEREARLVEATSLSIVRVGIVLGAGGGALPQLLLPFKLGFGGPIGSGQQPFPWVHIEDVCRLYAWLATDAEPRGVFNAVAPNGCDQRTFARTLGHVLGRPAILPTPKIALRAVLGQRSEAIAAGQHVVPRRTVEAGFRFEHPDLRQALADLLKA